MLRRSARACRPTGQFRCVVAKGAFSEALHQSMYGLLEPGLRVGTLNPVANGWYPKSCGKWLHGVHCAAKPYKPKADALPLH